MCVCLCMFGQGMSVFTDVCVTGFPFTLEIRENLEKEFTFFQSAKIRGI